MVLRDAYRTGHSIYDPSISASVGLSVGLSRCDRLHFPDDQISVPHQASSYAIPTGPPDVRRKQVTVKSRLAEFQDLYGLTWLLPIPCDTSIEVGLVLVFCHGKEYDSGHIGIQADSMCRRRRETYPEEMRIGSFPLLPAAWTIRATQSHHVSRPIRRAFQYCPLPLELFRPGQG
jgi:hypothetical protein